jgi:hypothetical protein
MRSRPPKLVHFADGDRRVLQDRLRDGHTEERVARRCRIILAMADPDTVVEQLAKNVALTRFGIRSVCRRFESHSLDAIQDEPRSGRPREISALEWIAIEQLASCGPNGPLPTLPDLGSDGRMLQLGISRGCVSPDATSALRFHITRLNK